ncbi:MAG TPA: SLC13 family permease [Bryobacteraceae bacterium]|jgi:anion transporter
MSTSTVSAPSVAAAAKHSIKWGWLAVAILVGLAVAYIPTPQGLDHMAQLVLAVIAGTVVLWAAEVMNNGVASLLMMGTLMAIGVPPLTVVPGLTPPVSGALSGFADGAWWTLLVVVYYGFAMKKTGLAERIAYYILSLFPGTYSGVLSAFFLIGLILSPLIPSMTVRTAIMAPIAWALVQTLGLKPRSKGSALIMLTVIEMAVVPGLAFKLGSLNGPVVVAMFGSKNIPLTDGGYVLVMLLPTLIMCVSILILNQLVLRPEEPIHVSHDFASGKLKSLGSVQRAEMITGFVVFTSIVFWVTAAGAGAPLTGIKLHHLPTFVVGMFGMAVLSFTGVFEDKDIGTGVSWTLLLFLGGIFSLTHIIPQYKITNWLAGIMVPRIQPLIPHPIVLLVVMALLMLAMRFIDPSAFIAIPLLWTPLVDSLSAGGIPPLVLAAPLLLMSAPFFLLYMNFWMAMGEGMTAKQGFSKGQLFSMATVYVVAGLAATIIGVFYWKIVGVF